jgi:hypothetical protein
MKITDVRSWSGFDRAAEGMKRSSRGIDRAADEIRKATQATLNGVDAMPVDRVEMRGAPDLQSGIMDLKLHKHGYTANLKVAQTSDEVFQSMIDMILPHQSDD